MLQNKKYGPDWELIRARKIHCDLYRLNMIGKGEYVGGGWDRSQKSSNEYLQQMVKMGDVKVVIIKSKGLS